MSIMATLEAQSAAEAAAAELRQMSRSPNPTYGRDFAIERRIGKGQFSVVYRATCQANGHVVALKKSVIFTIATI